VVPDARLWRVVPGQSLVCREWEDGAVLFNSLSGATHQVSDAALWLLDTLAQAPASAITLAGTLRAQGAGDIDPGQLASLLHELNRLHLIEPC
jgi:PqqD family protein of HPr-rel-A system